MSPGGFTEKIFNPCSEGEGVTLDDFRAYLPGHAYIFMPCCELWPAASVNAVLGPQPVLTTAGKPKLKNGKPVTIPANVWLDRHRPAHQMTWCPGLPALIPDRLVVDGGWIERNGVTVFNLYRAPRVKIDNADAGKAGPWIEHMHTVFGAADAEHNIKWFAQRVQDPQNKINHALVWVGPQGIGKDTAIEPLKRAIGPWNFHEVSPTQMLGRFNGFLKSIVLRISEGRDLGEVDRFKFYDHTKAYLAAPPDVLRVDEKNLREHSVFNVVGCIITTNHETDGIFLPADDRRHYVARSSKKKEDFADNYWDIIWNWYHAGGFEHVAAYLHDLDISDFNPKAPPPKTPAFWSIVNVNRAPEDAELADLLDTLGNPPVVTLAQLEAAATGRAAEWIMDHRNHRAVPHRMDRCGYICVNNPDAESDGRWKINGKRQACRWRSNLLLHVSSKGGKDCYVHVETGKIYTGREINSLFPPVPVLTNETDEAPPGQVN
jgi:hypothetical protein